MKKVILKVLKKNVINVAMAIYMILLITFNPLQWWCIWLNLGIVASIMTFIITSIHLNLKYKRKRFFLSGEKLKTILEKKRLIN